MKPALVSALETFEQISIRHISEYRELMFKYSESLKSSKSRYKLNLEGCHSSFQRADVVNDYILELHELLFILYEDKWKLKYAQKKERNI